MIQPVKQFRVTRLTISGFKGYADSRTFQFGAMNVISGHMGVGKSSIADAIAFAITGVGFYAGSKIDYLYHQHTCDLTVEMEFEDETGKSRILSRRRKEDKMTITLDGLPLGQGELSTIFGERDIFLSMFNPQYFIEVLGSKGRDLLERYLPEISREEVQAQLSEPNRALLEKQQFLSAEAYSKQLRGQVLSLERDVVSAQGQMTMRDAQQKQQAQELLTIQAEYAQIQDRITELETKRATGFDGTNLKEQLTDLYARYEELQREEPEAADTEALDTKIREITEKLAGRKAACYQSKYSEALSQTQAAIKTLRTEFARIKHIHDGLMPGVQCPVCRQTVTEQTLPQVRQEFAASLQEIRTKGCQLTAQLQEIQALDAKAQDIFTQYKNEDIAACEAELNVLTDQRKKSISESERQRAVRREDLARLHSEIQSVELDQENGMLSQEEAQELERLQARALELDARINVLSEMVQASPPALEQQAREVQQMQAEIQQKRDIINALAFFISKRVEINFSRLQMNRVAIALYDVVKSTGEVKDVFRFTYEGRDYRCLSHSEKIRAGLEVAELIKRLLGVVYPTFVDDVESVPVIDNVLPTGQLFVAKVVKGAALQVQVAETPAGAKAA